MAEREYKMEEFCTRCGRALDESSPTPAEFTGRKNVTEIEITGGVFLDLTKPAPESIHIQDIAHALSQLCRFTGHTKEFYSVAQHSVLVSKICEPLDAFAGLLHDAAEAYLGDVSRPLKNALTEYRGLEEKMRAVIFQKFGLPVGLPVSVKRADIAVLLAEKRDLVGRGEWTESYGVGAYPGRIAGWFPSAAELEFLKRFEELRP